VLSVWAAVLVSSAIAYPHLMSALVPSDYSVGGSDSAAVTHQMETEFPSAGAEQDVVVFDSSSLTIGDAAYMKTVNRVLARVRGERGVVSVLGPTEPGAREQVSAGGHAALAVVGLSGNDRQRADRAESLQDAVAAAARNGPVEASLTGYSPSANGITEVENSDVERAESFGVPVAFIVLLLALAAVVAASVPLLVAVVSLTATLGVLAILVLALGFEADAFLLSIVTMIGVGVSIDYSLFILTRFREELSRARREGDPEPVPAAVGVAMTTSGRTIAFSGTIVIISLFSLFLVNSPLFRGIALGAVLVVACTLLTAWTMLPALLGALGDRVGRWALPERFQPALDEEDPAGRPSGWERWARTVLAHPWLAIPAAALLIVFALPTFGLKVGIDLGMSALADKPSGEAVLVLERSFSPGAMSPIEVTASRPDGAPLSAQDRARIGEFTRSVSKDPRVTAAYASVNAENGSTLALVTVVPTAPVDSTEASELVEGLRDEVAPRYAAAGDLEILVGGETAQFKDLGEESLGKLPWVLAIVLSLSFLYLLLIFRSLLIPLKAVLMNLLATAAAFGLTAWVFQDGHLSGLFGFTSVGFVQVYLPIVVFALLFGLSMDYEVFLIRRMQEQWLKTHDSDDAVAAGIAHTARPILAAAAIMAAVFGCFLVADVLELKEFGFALAVAVILDATLVRLLLVPAIMKVAGPWNWWLPRWLDRILPRVRLD